MIRKFDRIRLGVLAGLALGALAAPASAGETVVRSFVFPLSSIGPSGVASPYVLPDPFSLKTGDTLDVTINFAGGAQSFTDDDWLFPLFFHDYGNGLSLSVSGTFQFLNPTGPLVSGPFNISQGNSAAHIGIYLPRSDYRTGDGAIGFTGVRQILTINSTTQLGPCCNELSFDDDGEGVPPLDTRGPDDLYNYATGAFWFDLRQPGGGGGMPVIPEPATWAMMIAGFGLVGGMMRRQRRLAAA
jgi:hypothetical protein